MRARSHATGTEARTDTVSKTENKNGEEKRDKASGKWTQHPRRRREERETRPKADTANETI